MMNDCGAFNGLLRFSNECRCGIGGFDATSCAYPVVATIKVSANTPAPTHLLATVAENAEVARTTADRKAKASKPLDMKELL
jgi:hypothetical protein